MLNKLEIRCVEITHKLKLTHLSSVLTALGIIDKLYMVKKPEDKFVLSSGHAFLAQAVVLEKNGVCNAEELMERHGTHPNRDVDNQVWVSTGSLGQGLPIAVGMAIARPDIDIYVLVSDGEMAEGSMWEALRIAGELRLENLKVAVNANGYSAIGKVDSDLLDTRMQLFYPSLVIKTDMFKYPDFLQGVAGHYISLTDEQYKEVLEC
jgi:transketolase N-terminal domain/subunit